MMYKACLFDLDGVLVDTAIYHFQAWKNLGKQFGYELTEEQNEQLKGVSRVESLNKILDWANYSATQEQKSGWLIEKNEDYLRLISNMNPSEILPGVLDFLQQIKFPSHGVHVKSSATYVEKGIKSEDLLNQTIQEAVNRFGTFALETDMRAMNNPTRMEVIEELAGKLVEKMKSCCPTCQRPGFSPTDVIRGLVCSCCSLPTKSVKSLIYSCEGCHYTTCVDFPDSKTTEDPMFCDFCNP